MAVEQSIDIRVNGVEATGLRLRRGMVNGHPSGPWDVLVEIPNLGYIPLDDKPDFIIETHTGPEVRNRVWKKVALAELITMLQSLGVIKS
jgi:hypothetical protein